VAPERLDTLRLAAPAESWCDQTPAVARDSLQALMTRSRSDVGVAVAGYAVAETDVRVEISKQYPDFSLGPGLFFDHGVNKWTVLFGIPSIPLHRNRGPIAEAEARRAAAAGHLESVQDSALAQVDAGLERCRLSGVALEAADSLAASVELRAARARAAYQRGETSLLELAFLDLARTRAARTHHLAEQQRREAGTRLEEAVGVWLTHPPARWPDVTRSPRPQPQETTQP
jgi:outer membrane protein TolC